VGECFTARLVRDKTARVIIVKDYLLLLLILYVSDFFFDYGQRHV
jgi:hypothetical protein